MSELSKINLLRLRQSDDWQAVIVPTLRQRHSELSVQLAQAAHRDDANAIRVLSGRLLEVDSLLGLHALVEGAEDAPVEETEANGRRDDVDGLGPIWARRLLRKRPAGV